MREEILELLHEHQELSPKELQEKLGICTSAASKELAIALNELEDERLIYNDHFRYVSLDDDQHWMVGKVRDISAGQYAVINKDKKVYVDKESSRIFLDKDEVLVRLGNKNQIVHVYERGFEYITGTFVQTRRGLKFRSDVDLHTSFHVTNLDSYDVKPNMKAVVKVVKYTSPLDVKIVKILGQEGEKGVDIEAILFENDVRQKFNKKVEKELEEIPSKVRKKDLKGRVDLRNLPTITIDGDTTKDFDDAISIEKTEDGWRLWVHIADVSYYVEEDDALDEEAYKRGTSIYIADRVIPMLPFQLSNGICSLNPHEDRLTLSVAMDFNKEGVMTDYDIMESVIHSDARTTYSKVNAFLEEESSVPEYASIGPMLHDFSDLATQLKKQTGSRGHIEFETREPYFVLDEKTGKPVDVVVKERGWSEQMIEEAMIAANVAVAHELHTKNLPGMFRVHELPDPERIENLVSFARAMHVPCDLNPEDVKPLDIAHFLENIEDKEVRTILSTMAVRAMAKARYNDKNLGHYGLALEEYCHFTSPIRRYPDLLIHRMLRRHVIQRKNDEKTLHKDEKKMEKSAMHLSDRERDAVTVERAVNDLKSAEYMEDKIGQEFEGIISGVASFGFFVELDNTIEGLVPMRNMKDDFYNFDQATMTLTGENTGRTFVMGQNVKVRLSDVNVPKRQVTFTVVEEQPAKTKEAAKPASESKPACENQPAALPQKQDKVSEASPKPAQEETKAPLKDGEQPENREHSKARDHKDHHDKDHKDKDHKDHHDKDHKDKDHEDQDHQAKASKPVQGDSKKMAEESAKEPADLSKPENEEGKAESGKDDLPAIVQDDLPAVIEKDRPEKPELSAAAIQEAQELPATKEGYEELEDFLHLAAGQPAKEPSYIAPESAAYMYHASKGEKPEAEKAPLTPEDKAELEKILARREEMAQSFMYAASRPESAPTQAAQDVDAPLIEQVQKEGPGLQDLGSQLENLLAGKEEVH